MPGGHEDGGRLAPQPELQPRLQLAVGFGPGQCHHQAGRPAGEIGRLVAIRRRGFEAAQLRLQPLLEQQRVGMVLVIVGAAAELAVAGLAVARDRSGIVVRTSSRIQTRSRLRASCSAAAISAGPMPRPRIAGATAME